MTERALSITKALRARIYLRDGGRCHCCGDKIFHGETWQAEHRVPLWNGGDDSEENLSPAHTLCHAPKTRREAADRAKAKRIGKPKKQSRPIPGSKRSGVKIRLTSDGPRAEKRKRPPE